MGGRDTGYWSLGLEQPKEEVKTPAYDETLAEATELDRRLEERRLEGIFTLPKDAPNVIKEARSPYFSIEMDQQPMTAHDISTLDSGEWLNDEVINFYMLLINKRSGSNPKLPKVHAFSSFFFNMLDGSGYARVRRWTRRINLFEKDMVVVPVNIDNRHWVCMVIDFRSKYITYYDSMLSGDYRRRDVLLNYLRQESEDKLKKPFDETGWATVCATDIPTQGNGYDCGVFTSAFAEYVSRDAPLVFSQKRCGFLREKMVYEIATMKLIS
ncbi:hypothetical protein EC988_003250 [Linderina pennispora]|nr:hypothetical protein EC988_003250 [Linderina pennispora]